MDIAPKGGISSSYANWMLKLCRYRETDVGDLGLIGEINLGDIGNLQLHIILLIRHEKQLNDQDLNLIHGLEDLYMDTFVISTSLIFCSGS